MKFYVLIPLANVEYAKVKDRDHRIGRVKLTSDYAEYFGEKNEYYIDWPYRVYKASGWKDISYAYGRGDWFYTALNPRDVIKKRTVK